MFSAILFISYYLVALFYLSFGTLLITHPRFVEHRIHSLFPLLAHFKLQRLANGVNLIVMGVILLLVGNLMAASNVMGFFLALVLSAWEVYLGVTFYYFEKKDIPQAVIHLVLHIALVAAVGGLILFSYSSQVDQLRDFCAYTISSAFHSWIH